MKDFGDPITSPASDCAASRVIGDINAALLHIGRALEGVPDGFEDSVDLRLALMNAARDLRTAVTVETA